MERPGPLIEEDFSVAVTSLIGERACVIVTDRHVDDYHGVRLPHKPRIVLEPGERYKTLETIRFLYGEFSRLGVDRHSLVLGVGGGVVTDMTGYAATTYMRGVSFGFAPTTLLAQVDAAHGGKNGVNLDGYKNLIGTFAEPEFVLIDHSFLTTQSERDFRGGYAEMIKIAAITDADLFKRMEDSDTADWRSKTRFFRYIMRRAVEGKLGIVMHDREERSTRKLLNFGHTIGHAIERQSGMPHGEAVAIGIALEAMMAERLGSLPVGRATRLRELLRRVGLPTSWHGEKETLCEAFRKDKKKAGEAIDLVVLEDIGVSHVQRLTYAQLTEALHDLC